MTVKLLLSNTNVVLRSWRIFLADFSGTVRNRCQLRKGGFSWSVTLNVGWGKSIRADRFNSLSCAIRPPLTSRECVASQCGGGCGWAEFEKKYCFVCVCVLCCAVLECVELLFSTHLRTSSCHLFEYFQSAGFLPTVPQRSPSPHLIMLLQALPWHLHFKPLPTLC